MSKANGATVVSQSTGSGTVTTTTMEGGDAPVTTVSDGAASSAPVSSPAVSADAPEPASAKPEKAEKAKPFSPFEAIALTHITRRESNASRDEVIRSGHTFEVRTSDERDQLVKMNAIAAPAAKD